MFALIGHRLLRWLQRCRVRHLMARMHLGRRVTIKEGLSVAKPGNVTIGDDVRINVNCVLQAHGPIRIGSRTMIAADCCIVTANHDMAKRGIEAFDTLETAPVAIGCDCWLGARVTVLPGVTIGDGAVVGAGSVVTHDLPAGMVCTGIPAEPRRERPGPAPPERAGAAG